MYVEAQARLFRLKIATRASPGGGDRGLVEEFSKASRRRMLELLARIDFERAGFLCFLTLTFPDGHLPPTLDAANRARAVFLKRLARRHPAASAIWRREWERRKSGRHVGMWFPHYHLLACGLPFLPHEELNAMWRGTIGFEGYVRTEIRAITTWRMAIAYVAKYMAKPRREAEWPDAVAPGRVLARSPHRGEREPRPAGDAGGVAPRSLVSSAYLTDPERRDTAPPESPRGKREGITEGIVEGASSIGRSWGVFHRKALPLGERRTITLREGPWLAAVRRRQVEGWPLAARVPFTGCTLFMEGAAAYQEALREIARAEGCDVERT